MVFDYITINDAFGYVAWPFSVLSTSWQNQKSIIHFEMNEEKKKEEKNCNLLRAQIFPLLTHLMIFLRPNGMECIKFFSNFLEERKC